MTAQPTALPWKLDRTKRQITGPSSVDQNKTRVIATVFRDADIPVLLHSAELLCATQRLIAAEDAISAFNTPVPGAHLDAAQKIDQRDRASSLYREQDEANRQLRLLVKRIQNQ